LPQESSDRNMKSTLSRAALIAFALEIMIVGAFAEFLSQKQDQPKQKVVMLTFPEVPAPPEPPKPKPPEPKPKVIPPKPVHPERPKQQHEVEKKPEEKKPDPAPAPSALPPRPSPPKPSTPAPPDVTSSFREEVTAAVQAAMQYPYAARMARIEGKTQVAFDYLDGAASNPSIAASSGYDMLDKAAILAVESAHYPSPPHNLSGRSLRILIWVRFYQLGQ
jgi:protein TonB